MNHFENIQEIKDQIAALKQLHDRYSEELSDPDDLTDEDVEELSVAIDDVKTKILSLLEEIDQISLQIYEECASALDRLERIDTRSTTPKPVNVAKRWWKLWK